VYKWGWDQKRKKYGPEAAALMMAGCSGFANSSSTYNNKQPQPISFSNSRDFNHDISNGSSTSLVAEYKNNNFPGLNSTPFPNDIQLEQLSNQLQKEDFYHHQSHKHHDFLSSASVDEIPFPTTTVVHH
jgi:hypothetical protein